jgi:photosystem II stability/assembly factor-like uncharacterized protein
VEGVDARTAYLLSAGNGDLSRIYKSIDGGTTWTRQFTSRDSSAFYDCFAFWSPDRGITMSDGVKGRFPVVRTVDGSRWEDIGDRLPAALNGEGAFAASGTCVAVEGDKRAWIATGAGTSARVLADDRRRGHLAGARRSDHSGDDHVRRLQRGLPRRAARHPRRRRVARPQALEQHRPSGDGGQTWTLATGTSFPGPVFGLTYVRGLGAGTVVATGPSGAAWSPDEGDHWLTLPGVENYWAVAFAVPRRGGWWGPRAGS